MFVCGLVRHLISALYLLVLPWYMSMVLAWDYHGTWVSGIDITIVLTHGIDLEITMVQLSVVLG